MSEYIVERTYAEGMQMVAYHEPIVRCRDCVNFVADELGEVCGLFEFEIVDGSMAGGFCKWGERKDND